MVVSKYLAIGAMLVCCLSGLRLASDDKFISAASAETEKRLLIQLHKNQGRIPGFLLISKDVYRAIEQAMRALERKSIQTTDFDTITITPSDKSVLISVFSSEKLQFGGGYEVTISTSDFAILSIRPSM